MTPRLSLSLLALVTAGGGAPGVLPDDTGEVSEEPSLWLSQPSAVQAVWANGSFEITLSERPVSLRLARHGRSDRPIRSPPL